MDQMQERLARIGLEVLGGRGFVLGGGHAVELHGMASRLSEDIDLFSPVRGSPGQAAADLVAAYRSGGFAVAVLRETADLVQLEVTGAGGAACKVDLGVFWRSQDPVLLEVGPVLHPDDAAGGKMDALFTTGGRRGTSSTSTLSWPAVAITVGSCLISRPGTTPDSARRCSPNPCHSCATSRIASSPPTAPAAS